ATASSEPESTTATSPISEASPAGQDRPAPSATQNVPYALSITPTANFIVFSGTRASGARAARPAAMTAATAAPAATADNASRCLSAPSVTTISATSAPSSSTSFSEIANE